MERILVGVDGSPASLDAFGWSADLARRAELELTAARVFEPTQSELPPDRDAELRDQQRRELDDWCRSVSAGNEPARALLVEGDPPDALLQAGVDENADLLVVGGRGSGGFLKLHIGSVAHHLTHHTTIPLAIVPGTGSSPIGHLVVGVDGSPASIQAAEFCAELAGRVDVGVTAVYSMQPFDEWAPPEDPRALREEIEPVVRDGWRRSTAPASGWRSTSIGTYIP